MKKRNHLWVKNDRFPWEYCQLCGVVRRADDKNRACREVRMRPMEQPLVIHGDWGGR